MPSRPTHAAVSQFISNIIPSKTNDVQLLYHVPRHPKYDSNHARVDQIVLSVTPTPGVYKLIGYEAAERAAQEPAEAAPSRPPRTICFLHRPFTLDRRQVRRGVLVSASHTSFDENLTVGWNTALANQLKMNVVESACVRGYKGDPDRKIGIVGPTSMERSLLETHIKQEFGTVEASYEGASDDIHAVAIMNAFHAEEVHRVLEVARQHGWLSADEQAGQHLLYLTGQPRESGLATAKEHGLSVVCVGHRAAEDWGIRYLASRLRSAFPVVDIKEVYEEESPIKEKE